MQNNQKKEMVESTARRFMQLDDVAKSYIIGFISGMQEERQKWVQPEVNVASTTI